MDKIPLNHIWVVVEAVIESGLKGGLHLKKFNIISSMIKEANKESTCNLQGIWVQPLVWEDCTCCGASKACVPQLLCRSRKATYPS